MAKIPFKRTIVGSYQGEVVCSSEHPLSKLGGKLKRFRTLHPKINIYIYIYIYIIILWSHNLPLCFSLDGIIGHYWEGESNWGQFRKLGEAHPPYANK